MIRFICGVPCSGKTTYRKKYFSETPYVDIYDFQRVLPEINVETVLETYRLVIEKALLLAKEGDVIIEHTLLKRGRREDAIRALREGGYDGEIHITFINPTKEVIIERVLSKLDKMKNPDAYVDNHLSILELPQEDEGFTSIEIVKDW